MNTSHHFSVATLNLYNYVAPPYAAYELDNIHSAKSWQKKAHWTSAILTEMDADIIAFQEVFSVSALETLVHDFGYKYFCTVEPPVRVDFVYQKPVVALASRYPIISFTEVVPDKEALSTIAFKESFSFARRPIKADIQVAGIGRVLVYVVHLKSKRSALAVDTNSLSTEVAIRKTLLAEMHGRWISNIQRGTEAALLYEDICQELGKEQRPLVVMGDLNDAIESPVLGQLIMSRDMDRLGGRSLAAFSDKEQRCLDKYRLLNASDLVNPRVEEKTHFMGEQGSVLDYILVSRDFDPGNSRALAEVTEYRVFNRHLVSPSFEFDAEASDHAPVRVTISGCW